MIAKAEKQALEIGHLKNSITSGEGNISGMLGEIIAAYFLCAQQSPTYNYDLIMLNGATVDVKTKRTTATPKPHYECSVAEYNLTQECDYYAFVRVHSSMTKGWYLGRKTKDDFFRLARAIKKGDKDGDNGFIVKADCRNIKISELDIP